LRGRLRAALPRLRGRLRAALLRLRGRLRAALPRLRGRLRAALLRLRGRFRGALPRLRLGQAYGAIWQPPDEADRRVRTFALKASDLRMPACRRRGRNRRGYPASSVAFRAKKSEQPIG
jgi:hypothetical protein